MSCVEQGQGGNQDNQRRGVREKSDHRSTDPLDYAEHISHPMTHCLTLQTRLSLPNSIPQASCSARSTAYGRTSVAEPRLICLQADGALCLVLVRHEWQNVLAVTDFLRSSFRTCNQLDMSNFVSLSLTACSRCSPVVQITFLSMDSR